VEAPPLIGQVEGLEDQREGRVVTAHALHGSLQRQEAMFLKIFIYGQFKFLFNYYYRNKKLQMFVFSSKQLKILIFTCFKSINCNFNITGRVYFLG
jgi:hypothetical protein